MTKEADADKPRQFGIKGRYFGNMSEDQAKEILERADKGTNMQRISLLRQLAVHRAKKVLGKERAQEIMKPDSWYREKATS